MIESSRMAGSAMRAARDSKSAAVEICGTLSMVPIRQSKAAGYEWLD